MVNTPNFREKCLASCKLPPDEDMIDCLGLCSNKYHTGCVGLNRLEAYLQEWVCDECQNLPSQEMTLMRSQDGNLTNVSVNSQPQSVIASVANIMDTEQTMQRVETQAEVINSQLDRVQNCESPYTPIFGPETEVQFNRRRRQESRLSSLRKRLIGRTVATNDINNDPEPRTDVEANSDKSSSNTNNVDENDYEVQAIVAHGTYDDGTIGYRIRWHGCRASDDTWIKENELIACYKTLNDYKKKHQLGPPTFKKPYGSTQSNKWNPSIWNSADRIISTVRGYLRKEFRNLLEIKVTEPGHKLDSKDCLYLIDYDSHVMVGYYKASANTMTIADGENCYYESSKARNYINKWKNLSIRAVRFTKQSKIDHCSSSAAMICIKFANHHGFQTAITDPITIPNAQKEKIIRSMHKGPSRSLKGWIPVQRNASAVYCEYSGCSYKGTRKQITAHSRTHAIITEPKHSKGGV